MIDDFFFIGLPYATLITFLVGTIYRYRATKFTYSSLSSQFLETQQLFWGTMPFHWGLLVLFLGHLGAFLFPREVLLFNGKPARLLILEAAGFAFGVIVLFGLLQLFYRRINNPRIRPGTTKMDIVLELVLIIQVVLGLLVATQLRWGSSWFAAVLTPYLRSIFRFQPDIEALRAMPLLIKLHIVGAYVVFMLVPFTRLVHLLVIPIAYLWRPYQRVIWNYSRRTIRNPEEKWNVAEPSNN